MSPPDVKELASGLLYFTKAMWQKCAIRRTFEGDFASGDFVMTENVFALYVVISLNSVSSALFSILLTYDREIPRSDATSLCVNAFLPFRP